MSWEEYKTKNSQIKTQNTTSSLSSWETYKKKKEQEKKLNEKEFLIESNKKANINNVDGEKVSNNSTNKNEAIKNINSNKQLSPEMKKTLIQSLNNEKTNNITENKTTELNQKNTVLKNAGELIKTPISDIIGDNELHDIKYLEKELGTSDSFFETSEAFKDGYQLGDVTKTVGSTIGDVGLHAVKGISNLGEGIGDLIVYGEAQIADMKGNTEKANQLRENAKKNMVDEWFEPATKAVNKNSVLGNKSDELAEGLGYVAGMTAVSIVSGGAGAKLGLSSKVAATIGSTATTFSSSMGNGMSEAYQNGATDEEAFWYGVISGAGEAGSELMFGGLGKASGAIGLTKGVGEFDDQIAKSLTKNIKNKMVKTLIQSGVKAAGEGAEEVVSGLISAVGKKATYMSDEDLQSIIKDENLAEQFWMGALTSAIAQGPSTIKSVKNGTDFITGYTENEQKVYDTLTENKANEEITKKTVDNMINEQKETLEKAYGRELTANELTEIENAVNAVKESGKLNTENTKLSKKERGAIEENIKEDLENGNLKLETIKEILGEDANIDNDSFLQRSVYENEQKYSNYKAEFTGNEKVDKLLQSAVDSGVNNTSKTRKMVDVISKLVENTDRQYRFVNQEQLKKMGYNENANGLTDKSTGEILLSVNSNKQIEAVVGHETTHLFDNKVNGEYTQEYKDLQNSVTEYLKSNGTYEAKIKEIMDTYTKAGITLTQEQLMEEITADTIGDNLFGKNAETFINNLTTNRNVFQKIYDYIKKAVMNLKGYKTEEAKRLQNLKDSFDKVYKTLNTIGTNTDTDTKYSIAGRKGMNNAIKEDSSNLVIERSYNQALKMAQNGTDNETIRKTTNWFQDKNGDWKFEFSDKYMTLKNIKLEKNKTYKLGNILMHDILFEAYPELANYKVSFKNMKANGSYNNSSKSIRINNNKINSKLSIESTLIHEIQHAIQNVEGFEKGASSKPSKLRYYKTLGEIEAKDTQNRFLKEINGNLNRKTTAPESSKINPKHANLDNYLKNRKAIDKIKDGIYNYFKGKGVNYEVSQEFDNEDTRRDNILVDGRVSSEENTNIKYSLSRADNQGRELSKGQQEYFKDSKARNEDGNLETVYHGTNNVGFTEFNRNVNYFTNNKNVANTYTNSDGLYEGYVNIKEPVTINANGEKWSMIDVDNITIDGISDIKTFLNNYGASTWKEKGKLRTSTADLVSAIYDAVDEGEISADGIIIKNIYDEGAYSESVGKELGTDYITFNSNQFKNSDNTNPTASSDIRYSISDSNKPLEERVSGDELLNTQDFINEIQNVGAEVDTNGYVTVYHQTTEENANKIKENGKMSAKEDGIFFSTSKNAQQSEGRGQVKLEFKLPAEMLKLDDIFLDNADVKIPLKNKNESIDVSKYLVNNENIKQQQFDIIRQTNPADDDIHTWIRSVEDIKTFKEALEYDDYEGQDLTPDLTQKMVNNALNTGKITVYSSYEIKNGTFVTPSRMEAESYAGSKNVYSKQVNLQDVAWIDSLQGQYAATNSKYSMTQGNTDQYWKKQTIDNDVGNISNTENSEQGSFNLPKNIENDVGDYNNKTIEDVLKQTPEEKQNGMKLKAKNYISRSRSNFINNIVNNFGTSKLANTKTLNDVTERIRQDIANNGTLSTEQKNSYFNELYDNLVKIDTEYYDTYKDVKNDIRKTKLFIDNTIRSDITDFDNFRKANMGNIIMTSDSSNISIDQYYKELSSEYPELFPDDIINPTQQLERIADVTKDITKVETNVAAYNDANLGKDYRYWARETFDKDIDKFSNDIKMAERYNSESKTTEKLGITKDFVKELYKQLPSSRIKYEKVSAKEVLTQRDRVQVDRLLNNEISIDEIPADCNKQGIIKLATAKADYDGLQKAIKEYQTEIKNKRIEEARNDVGILDLWKDKKIGFQYSRETPIRNIYDVAPKNVADTIVNKYFRPYIETNEKSVVSETNNYFDRVRDLELSDTKKYKIDFEGSNKKVSESTLVQLLGENKISTEQIKEAGADVTKISNAVNEFRNIYNELFEKINESMLDNGYAPVEYRKDYFPHFTETTTDTLLGKAAKLLGIDITNREELPTDIAGQSYKFKPGRTWFGNLLQRTTDATDYDAKKGFEKYVKGAMDLIYHTGDIQNLRALSTAIRTTYNQTEIANQVAEINESTMSDYDKAVAIEEIYNQAKDRSHLSKFVEWLDNYTNLLAGKKAINDRGAEKELNRQMYKTMTGIESRIAANAIGGNVGVSFTNFAPLAQAWGEVKTHNLVNGIWQTMKATLKGDSSFASESQFITRRRGIDSLTETTLNKITKPLDTILGFADNFTSEAIVRAKYNQNLQEGMNQQQALEEADRYVAGLMADRGRGALPTQFSNKNPIAKMINMFQVEVNNQWSYYLKDLPKNMQEKANNNKAKVIKNTAIAYTKVMVGSYLINELLGSIRGNSTRVLPDPIYIIKELINGLSDDDDDNDDDAVIETLTEVAGNVPFVSLPATLFADSLGLDVGDIGRVSVSGAIPNISDIVSDLMDKDKTGSEKAKSIGGELLDTVGSSLVLPYGGSQIKKTVKGLSLYNNELPGSYTDSGDLRYTVDDDLKSKVQAGIFGAWANPYAQDYVDSGYKTISKKNIDEMVGLDMNSSEYREFRKGLSAAGTKTEDKLNYIDASDLTTEQKNLVANNLNSNSKKSIDMEDYGDYNSYEEYKYSRDYPEKYNVIKQIDSYDNFEKYKDDISNIKKQYSTDNGYSTSQRKSAVQSYIEGLDLNMYQKMMLEHEAGGYSIKEYSNYIQEYLDSTDLTDNEKYYIWEELFEKEE